MSIISARPSLAGYRQLISRALPADEVLPAAQELARDLAANTSAVSVAATKALVYDGLGQDREESHAVERQVFRWMGNSADAAEGVTAFLEKRAPQWPLSKVKDYPPMLLPVCPFLRAGR